MKKFRAWDNGYICSFYIDEDGRLFELVDGYEPYMLSLDAVLEQSTGVEDKSGNEIFEGDLFTLGDPNIVHVVEFKDGAFVGRQITNKSIVGLDFWRDRIEIIGNIHEDKE